MSYESALEPAASDAATPNRPLSSKNTCVARSAKIVSLMLLSTSISDIPWFKPERNPMKAHKAKHAHWRVAVGDGFQLAVGAND